MKKILNNKTVKMIGAIVLVLFVALVLTGCGCSGQPTEGGVAAPDPIVGFKSFWDLFVWPMAAIMWVVGKVMGGNYGLTIIFTTILVRTAAWPIYKNKRHVFKDKAYGTRYGKARSKICR